MKAYVVLEKDTKRVYPVAVFSSKAQAVSYITNTDYMIAVYKVNRRGDERDSACTEIISELGSTKR